MVHVRQGNAFAAISSLEQGLRLCNEVGLTALAFHGIAASLGTAYALANREADPVPFLRRVADQSWSMKLVSDHLLGAIPLAEVRRSLGHLDAAGQVAQQSPERARAHGQRGHEAHALRRLGAVAARRDPPDTLTGETNHLAALLRADQVLSIAQVQVMQAAAPAMNINSCGHAVEVVLVPEADGWCAELPILGEAA